jgi:type VI protein secretion system component Hcp
MILQYRLVDVAVTSVEVSGKEEGNGWIPLERISLRYGKIEWSYTKINEANGAVETVKAGWDVTANKAI